MKKETFQFDLKKGGEIVGEGKDAFRMQILASPGEPPLTPEAKKMMEENMKKALKKAGEKKE